MNQARPDAVAHASVEGIADGRQHPPATRAASSVIGRRTATGAFWIFLATAAGRMIAFITNIVLVRLLSPDDFGLVSFSMVMIGAFLALQELGVPEAIVYGNRDVRKIGGTALTINFVTSLLLLAIVLLTAPWYARFGGHEDVRPIASVLALGLVISSLGSVQNALLIKELAFRRKFLPDVAPLIASSLLSMALAFMGFGVWSLVIGYVARSAATTIVLWVLSPIRPYPRFDWHDAKEMLGYGRHVSFAAILGFIGTNADYFVVGLRLGAYQLGIYWVAFVTASLPVIVLGGVLSTATFPAYSAVRGDIAELRQLFRRVFQTTVTLTIPIGALMFFGAPAYVTIVLNSEWSEVLAPLQILSIFAMLRSIGLMFPPIFKAVGRPEVEWRIRLVRLAILIPALYWATGYGIKGAALAQVAVSALFVPINAIIITRLIEITPRQLAKMVAPQLITFCGLAALAVLANGVAGARQYSLETTGSIVTALVAAGIYAAIMLLVYRHRATWGYQMVLQRLGR